MNTVLGVESPKLIDTEYFTDAPAAVDRLQDIYVLRNHLEAYARGEPLNSRVRATYPFVRIMVSIHSQLDSRLSYGFVSGPGVYQTTVTRFDLFRAYLNEQIGLLIQNAADLGAKMDSDARDGKTATVDCDGPNPQAVVIELCVK